MEQQSSGDTQQPQQSSDQPTQEQAQTWTPTPNTFVGGAVQQPVSFSSQQSVLDSSSSTGFIKPARAYLAEYAVLLIVTTVLIGLSGSMFSSILDYAFGSAKTPRFGGSWAYTSSLATLAAALVLIPVFGLLTRRTNLVEQESVTVRGISWRKAFLGLFLIVLTLNALGYAIAFSYEVISKLASIGLATAQKGEWRHFVKYAFSAALFAATAWLYSRDYRSAEATSATVWRRLHRYSLVTVATLLGLVFAFVPVRIQRNSFIDSAIVSDINDIHSKVSDYQYKQGRLPRSLDDLSLTDEVKAHADAYKYEFNTTKSGYDLCAVFKTDTTKNKDSGNVLEQFASGGASLSDYASSSSPNPSRHSAGRSCFSYKSSFTSINSNSSRPSLSSPDNYDDYYNSSDL